MYIKIISTRCRPVQTRMQTGHCPDFATLQQCHKLSATFSTNIKKFNVMNTILWQGRFYLFQERQIYASSMGIHVSYCRWHDLLIFYFYLFFFYFFFYFYFFYGFFFIFIYFFFIFFFNFFFWIFLYFWKFSNFWKF